MKRRARPAMVAAIASLALMTLAEQPADVHAQGAFGAAGVIILRADGDLRKEIRHGATLPKCTLFRADNYEFPEKYDWSLFVPTLKNLISRISQVKTAMDGDFDIPVSDECHAIREWVVVDAPTFNSGRCTVTSAAGAAECNAPRVPTALVAATIRTAKLSARHRRQLIESVDPAHGIDTIPSCADCNDLRVEILSAAGSGTAITSVANLAGKTPADVVGLFVHGLGESPNAMPSYDLDVGPESVLADACACLSDEQQPKTACRTIKALVTRRDDAAVFSCMDPRSPLVGPSGSPPPIRSWKLEPSAATVVLPTICKGARLKAAAGSSLQTVPLGDGQRGMVGPSWLVLGDMNSSSLDLDTQKVANKDCNVSKGFSGITVLSEVELLAPSRPRDDAPSSAISCVRGSYPTSSALVRIETDLQWSCLSLTRSANDECGDFRVRVFSSPWVPLGLASTDPDEQCLSDPSVGPGEPVRLLTCPAAARKDLAKRIQMVLPLRVCPAD